MHYLKSLSLAMETAPEKTRAQIFSIPCSAGTGPLGSLQEATHPTKRQHQPALHLFLMLLAQGTGVKHCVQ